MKRYLFKFKFSLFISAFFIILLSILSIMLAYVFKYLFDAVENKNWEQFKNIVIFMIIYLLLLIIILFLKRYFQSNFIRKVMVSLKEDIFSKVINKNINEFNNEKTAQYISALTNDLNILESDYYNNILEMFSSIFSFILATVLLIRLNVYISIGVFITTVITVFVPQVINKRLQKSKVEYSNQVSNFVSEIKDVFTGFEVIKCFNIEGKVAEKYGLVNNDVEKSKFNAAMLSGISEDMSYVLACLMSFTAMSLGAYFTIKGVITIGTMIAAAQLMNNIANPVVEISSGVNTLKSVKLLKEKISKIIDTSPHQEVSIHKETFDNQIAFKNVNFAYKENDNVIKDVSFSVEKGKKYAVVGQSGCGKSTLMKLLAKYYENYEGQILIDGTDIKDISAEDLYKLISTIHQNVFLFDGTIKDNICLFNNYSEEDLQRAVMLSGLDSTVKQLPKGIDTMVGESGSNLSGGQKQRISIARAIIRKTPIIVLDEATASLDAETAHDIEDSILNLKSLTAIVITHRLSKELLKRYDSIIAIKSGEIAEEGSFDELMNNKGYFYNLFNIQ